MLNQFGDRFETIEQFDTALVEKAAHLLSTEFYSSDRYEEGIADYAEQLESGNSIAKISMVDGEIVGISTFNIFNWDRIRGQLYYQAAFKGNQLASIRLRKFEDCIDDVTPIITPSIAAEMAYNFVLPEHRGKGLGSYQWRVRMQYINDNYENPLIFTLARSEYSGMGIAPLTIKYMLVQERIAQGLEPDAQVDVQGIDVLVSQMGRDLGMDIEGLDMNTGSKPTLHLAQGDGFSPIGFSRNFCPVWVKQIVNKTSEF